MRLTVPTLVCGQERCDIDESLAVLIEERVAAVVGAQDRPGNRSMERLSIDQRRQRIEAAGRNQRRHRKVGQAIPGVVMSPGVELAQQSFGNDQRRAIRRDQGQECVDIGICPGPRVDQGRELAITNLRFASIDLVQRSRGSSCSPARRAHQHQLLNTLGSAQSDLLSDHATERDPHQRESVDAEVVDERIGVVREVRHRRLSVWGSGNRLSESPVVEGDATKAGEKGHPQWARRVAKVRACAADVEQRRSAPTFFVEQIDVGEGNERHITTLVVCLAAANVSRLCTPGLRGGTRTPTELSGKQDLWWRWTVRRSAIRPFEDQTHVVTIPTDREAMLVYVAVMKLTKRT